MEVFRELTIFRLVNSFGRSEGEQCLQTAGKCLPDDKANTSPKHGSSSTTMWNLIPHTTGLPIFNQISGPYFPFGMFPTRCNFT